MEQGRVGSGRMKAPRGCENLKAQVVGSAVPTDLCRCPEQGNAEGVKTSREALLVGVRFFEIGRRVTWETRGSRQRLGVWAASEEEPKPMRGAREQFKCFSGASSVKTL